MVDNIYTCDRELGCRVLFQAREFAPPIATDYLKTTRRKTYHNYTLFNGGDTYSELYVNDKSMVLLHVVSDSEGNGKCLYDSKVIDIENDLTSLSMLMKHLLPNTDEKEWNKVIDNLMVCIMRDTNNALEDKSCGNCTNTICTFRNTGNVCYAYI